MSVFLEIWFSQASVIKIRFAQNGMKKGKNKSHELARIKNNLMQKTEKKSLGRVLKYEEAFLVNLRP